MTKYYIGIMAIVALLVTSLFVEIKQEEQLKELNKLKTQYNTLLEENKKLKEDINWIMAHKQDVVYNLEAPVSAYNVGDIEQNDASPCQGAAPKVDLCKEVSEGRGVCATRRHPLHTKIEFENGIQCEVLDRTGEKYANRIDLAFALDEKSLALEWGVKVLKYRIIN